MNYIHETLCLQKNKALNSFSFKAYGFSLRNRITKDNLLSENQTTTSCFRGHLKLIRTVLETKNKLSQADKARKICDG